MRESLLDPSHTAHIDWPIMKLAKEPFRHYRIMPEGIPIPLSVSSVVLGHFETDKLIKWGSRLALEAKTEGKSDKQSINAAETYRDDCAAFGTIVHDSIEAFLKGWDHCENGKPVIPDCEKARTNFYSALAWLEVSGLRPVECERKIYLTVYRPNGLRELKVAGTFDLLCVDGMGRFWIVDWKNSTRIKSQHFVQEGGYCEALCQHGIGVHGMIVVRLKKGGGCEVASTTKVATFRELFKREACLHQSYHDAKQFTEQRVKQDFIDHAESAYKCDSCEVQTARPTWRDRHVCIKCYAKDKAKEQNDDLQERNDPV